MASWLATGPPVMVWCPPARVVSCAGREVLHHAGSDEDDRVPMIASGSRMRRLVRTRSTQKLPSRSVLERVKPRIRATATAMPTAAEAKFCTASPAICTRWPIVDSPE